MAFHGVDLNLELVDPNTVDLVRLYKPSVQRDGYWEPPPDRYRNFRVDPPVGEQHRYAVLYLGDTLPLVATECQVLFAEPNDHWVALESKAKLYHVARYAMDKPAVFLPIDGANRRHLLPPDPALAFRGGYALHRSMALQVFERYGDVIHGLSWASFHRNQPGRAYALWHHQKAHVGLRLLLPTPHDCLHDTLVWQQFLSKFGVEVRP